LLNDSVFRHGRACPAYAGRSIVTGLPAIASAGEGPAIHEYDHCPSLKCLDARHKAGHD
jgi:hypothetical protein